jgi:serine protease
MFAARRSFRAPRPAIGRFLALLAITVMSVAACGDDDDPTGPGSEVQLTSGTAVTGIAGGEDSERYYRITVPTGATFLTVTTSGGTGDVDIAVRHAERPTFDEADCFSSGESNTETCVIEDPAAGTWYIGLYGFEAYSGASLTATVSTAPGQ